MLKQGKSSRWLEREVSITTIALVPIRNCRTVFRYAAMFRLLPYLKFSDFANFAERRCLVSIAAYARFRSNRKLFLSASFQIMHHRLDRHDKEQVGDPRVSSSGCSPAFWCLQLLFPLLSLTKASNNKECFAFAWTAADRTSTPHTFKRQALDYCSCRLLIAD